MNAKTWRSIAYSILTILALLALGACGDTAPEPDHGHEAAASLQPVSLEPGEKLRVVATTNIVGDVVANVGGDRIELTTLMGIGVDPHTYVPTPSDTAALHDAHLVIVNGAGLEADLEEMLHNAGGSAVEVDLSSGLELHPAAEGAGEDEGDDHGHDHGELDPHVWFDVRNVIHWTEAVDSALATADPGNAAYYHDNAQDYSRELEDLDAWVVEQVAAIPAANRKLVVNHPTFGYLAERYGLEQLGAVYPAGPSAEPSAQDIAALEDAILDHGVGAIFTETTVRPGLAQQVAEDTGAALVSLYTGSLGAPGSGVESYVELIRFDVSAIVGALQ
jgi:ABC-type Zn uptake system ZnuABC Zn-binding protein ZnuA